MSIASDPPPEKDSLDASPAQYNLDQYSESEPEKPVTTRERLDFYLNIAEIIFSPSSASSLRYIIVLTALVFVFFLVLNPFHVVADKIQSGAADTLFKLVPAFIAGFWARGETNQVK